MGIRLPAAEKLVRQLLELRPPRITPLPDKFISVAAKMVQAYVDIDEQRARTDELVERTSETQTLFMDELEDKEM